jgi:chemotaxis protein MotB
VSGARTRRGQRTIDYWPGFVDALSTLVLAVVFLLTVFMLAQFFLSQQVTDKDTALQRLTRQISELTDLLALEKINRKTLEDNLTILSDTLRATEAEKSRLAGLADSNSANAASAGSQASTLGK